MWLPFLIAFSVGLAVFGIGWLAYGYHLQISNQVRRQRQFNRLERLERGVESAAPDPDQIAENDSWLERLAPFLAGQTKGPASEQTSEERRLLAQAGYRGMQALVLFQALRLILMVVVLLAALSYAFVSGSPKSWLKVFLAVGVAYLAPKYILKWLAGRRMQDLANEIPLFIDYLRMMHGAGVSFEQALILFSEEKRVGLPVLSSEFNVVRIAIKSGRARNDALQQMSDQLGQAELKELVTLVNDADRYGAGLQEPLKRYAVRLMEKRRFDMQDYVGKLATRMVVVMVVFLLPALIIVTAGPGFVAVFKALVKLT
ncbi:MAG: type II secretion system F family protein [Thiobacillus sp.]|nr:type II secretion system F family protein [Thiobacillus sp.]